jgi:hypothetical protein
MASDQDIIARLRQAQSSDAGQPIEVTTVLALGRRRRRRRTFARWGGGVGISVMAVTATVALSAHLDQPNQRHTTVAATTVATHTAEPSSTPASAFVPAEILDSYEGWPKGVDAAPQSNGAFADLNEGTLTVWTSGGTTCPVVPKEIQALGDVITIEVGLEPDPDAAYCTMDSKVTSYVLAIPDQYTADQEPTVELIGWSDEGRTPGPRPRGTPRSTVIAVSAADAKATLQAWAAEQEWIDMNLPCPFGSL